MLLIASKALLACSSLLYGAIASVLLLPSATAAVLAAAAAAAGALAQCLASLSNLSMIRIKFSFIYFRRARNFAGCCGSTDSGQSSRIPDSTAGESTYQLQDTTHVTLMYC